MAYQPAYITEKQAVLTRPRRIDGQIRGAAPRGPTSPIDDLPPQRVELAIGGMTCASCAARIEKKPNKLPKEAGR